MTNRPTPCAIRSASANPSCDRGETGSAYIVTLMVLFVLTIVGLSLTLVTQTEALIGSQDRITQRVFYSADAGLGVAVAKALAFEDTSFAYDVVFQGLTDRVEVSPFIPLDAQDCTGCELNQGPESYKRIPFAVNSVASRIGLDAGGNPDVILARRELSVMIEFIPWDTRLVNWSVSPEEAAKVHF